MDENYENFLEQLTAMFRKIKSFDDSERSVATLAMKTSSKVSALYMDVHNLTERVDTLAYKVETLESQMSNISKLLKNHQKVIEELLLKE